MEETTFPRYAGFWVRGLAYTVDDIIYKVMAYVIAMALGHGAAISYLVATGLTIIYYVGFLSSPWQATPGKRLLNIHVTTIRGERVSSLRACARWLVVTLPGLPSLFIITFNPGMEVLTQAFLSKDFYAIQQAINEYASLIYLIEISGIIAFVCMFIWYLPIVFTRQKTGLHDIICKTRVVYGKA